MAGGDGGAVQLSRKEKERKKAARLVMMEMSHMIAVPMSLYAVVRLNVPEAIYQSGLNAPLTATQILSRLRLPPTTGDYADSSNLQRILRLLASHGVFREHLGERGERRYSLTDVGMTLVAGDGPGAASYGAYVLQHHQEALVRAWPLLHEAVLDPRMEPFARANGGVTAYASYGKDPEANALMQRAMTGLAEPFMEALLEHEAELGGLFDGVGKLVDVGGNAGTCLKMIVQRVPGVKAGVNFDLPEVVAGAPPFPGITHVGGDMFNSIPSGDAIFMKWVLVSWTDEECGKILKNCCDALPQGGKLIACEPVLPEETDGSRRTWALLEADIFIMAMYRATGKVRTEEEHRQLGSSAGFPSFRAIYLDHFFTVMIFQK